MHNSYLVPGVTDDAVVRKQAEDRRDKRAETTIVHAHPYNIRLYGEIVDTPADCNESCMIYVPGQSTIPYFDWERGSKGSPLKEDA